MLNQEISKEKFIYLTMRISQGQESLYAKIYNSGDHNIIFENVNLNDLRDLLIKDIDKEFIQNDRAFIDLFMNYFAYDKEVILKEQGYMAEVYEKISDNEENHLGDIYLNKDFENTLNYFK